MTRRIGLVRRPGLNKKEGLVHNERLMGPGPTLENLQNIKKQG